MSRLAPWAALAALAALVMGCSYPEEQFRADVDDESCRWQVDCFDYEQSWTSCVADAAESWSTLDPELYCDYDQDAAKSCVAGISQMECPVDGYQAAFPSACDAVWACDSG